MNITALSILFTLQTLAADPATTGKKDTLESLVTACINLDDKESINNAFYLDVKSGEIMTGNELIAKLGKIENLETKKLYVSQIVRFQISKMNKAATKPKLVSTYSVNFKRFQLDQKAMESSGFTIFTRFSLELQKDGCIRQVTGKIRFSPAPNFPRASGIPEGSDLNEQGKVE